ncbi:MAG: VOC family protein [Polyangiaceae bacterium]
MSANANQATKPCPKPWPRISTSIFYDDAAKAIDWLCEAFGFEVILKVEGEGGRIEHSELMFGDGLIMVGQTGGKSSRPEPLPGVSPRSLGGKNTQMQCVMIDDADAHCENARKAGATIIDEPFVSDYGEEYWADKSYRAEDVEGHHWFFVQRLKTGKG